MAERNPPFGSIICRSSLFFVFTIASFFFIFSWFSVLHSTSHPHSIDLSSSPNSRLFAVIDNKNTQPRNQDDIQPSVPNMSGSVNCKEEAPQDKEFMKCNPNRVVKVFMYDLPPEFHFGLLDWKPEGNGVWPDLKTKIPDYPGGLNLQHSIEYWLTLDLLSSTFPDSTGTRSAVRMHNSSEADVIFVPFFSSLSYNRYSKPQPHEKNRNYLLQEKLVKFLAAQEEWKRSGGRDHIIMAHHPNSMLDARMKLWPAMFILSDFGRYPPTIANVQKDVIAPYKHIIRTFVNDSSSFDDRPTLLYFQGAIYRKDGGYVRQELFYLLKDEKDVHFSFGSVNKGGINKASKGMHSSKFCLNIAGDTPSSNRLFDAIASHCVPVIISDQIELPYEDVLDYSEFCIFVPASDAVKENYLIKLIRSIKKEKWTRMWKRLKQVEKFFEFQYPSHEDDAVQMIWQTVARKVPSIRLELHKSKRFSQHTGRRKRDPIAVPRNFW
ncbi:probable arabinosyltransferase ARAD1 [Macadamia integrifolia]|uniref:probable arabinosyltransferase ARAD1 n=1 Tax=Macadamia integrifolia TaxID=60698 RepID=UPI001C4FE7CD|nr:probable arabinosyltransferase ARAD1 [Macadamia integrifolia]